METTTDHHPKLFVVVFGGESDDDDDGFPELGTTTRTTTTTTTKKRDDGQNGGGWWSRRRPEENYASERSENGGVFVPRGESGNESAERSDGDHRNSRYRRRSGVDTAHWSDERVHRAIIYDLYSFTYVPQIPSSLENETVFFAVVFVSSTRERRLHTIPRFFGSSSKRFFGRSSTFVCASSGGRRPLFVLRYYCDRFYQKSKNQISYIPLLSICV